MLKFNDFIIKNVLDESHLTSLIKFSQADEAVQNFTQDQKRFVNADEIKDWAKNRLLFVLTDQDNRLAGLSWILKKTIMISNETLAVGNETSLFDGETSGLTFAVRIYPPFRGQGLSMHSCKFVLDKALKNDFCKGQKSIWLTVHKDNVVAIALYEKLGFKLYEQTNNNIKMIKKI